MIGEISLISQDPSQPSLHPVQGPDNILLGCVSELEQYLTGAPGVHLLLTQCLVSLLGGYATTLDQHLADPEALLCQGVFGAVLEFIGFFPHQSSAKTKPRCGYRVSGSLFSLFLLTSFAIPSVGFLYVKPYFPFRFFR